MKLIKIIKRINEDDSVWGSDLREFSAEKFYLNPTRMEDKMGSGDGDRASPSYEPP